MVPSPRELNPRSLTPRANALLTELSCEIDGDARWKKGIKLRKTKGD